MNYPPDPWRTTIRLSPAARELLDELGRRLAPAGEAPLSRTAVLLRGLRGMAEREGLDVRPLIEQQLAHLF